MFDWDDANRSHIRRHRIRPEEAEQAANDPRAVPLPVSVIEGELREPIIGLTTGGRLLVVVVTDRDELLRVVTARRAAPHEERLYWR